MIDSMRRSLVYFFQGLHPHQTQVTPVNVPLQAGAAGPGQQSQPGVDLPARSVQALAADPLHALRVVPSQEDVLRLFQQLGFSDPLGLGLALKVSPGYLLSQHGWWNPVYRVKRLLLKARFPLDLVKLSCALAAAPLHARETAIGVHELAGRAGYQPVGENWLHFREQLALILAPLADEQRLLGAALGLTTDDMDEIRRGLTHEDRENSIRQLLAIDARRREEQGAPPRSCGDWLRVMDWTGADSTMVEAMARHWQLPCPADYNWQEHQCAFHEGLTRNLLFEHRYHPEAAVPLDEVFLVLRSFLAQPGFLLALDDGSDPCRLTEQERRDLGVCCLLRHARPQGRGGQSISRACLYRLVRHGCAPHGFDAPPAHQLPAETASRRLCPSDFLSLVEGDNPQRQAFEVAAALGAGVRYRPDKCGSAHQRQEQALLLWRWIDKRIPWLETGHLVQLFRQLGHPQLVEQLTHDPDSAISPARAVHEHSAQAAVFMRLAEQLRKLPERVQAFIDQNNLVLHPGYRAPEGTAQAVRLLSCLALDAPLLGQWRAFRHGVPVPDTQDKNHEGIPFVFLCPITFSYMQAPVAVWTTNGIRKHFDKEALLQTLRITQYRNPLTNEILFPWQLGDVDEAHRERIRQWRAQHPELEPDHEASGLFFGNLEGAV